MASEPFRDAAQTQATSLGIDTARVFVSHPIQDRTDAELMALADGAIEQLLAALTAAP